MAISQALPEPADGATAQAALCAQQLHHGWGRHSVLRGVELQVECGSIVGLVGRNGVGKSTLLECMLGMHRPDQGRCHVLGQPALQLRDAHKAQIGYVSQGQSGFEWMRVAEFLGLMASLYPRWDAVLVQRLLRTWALDAQQRMLSLSPGQRQQVALIRALAHRPQLLVLDEPAASLDPVARRHVLREVVDLALHDGATVVFSSHILSDLERIASHMSVLAQGRIQLHESLDAIKEQWHRLVLPAAQLPQWPAVPGEVQRRMQADGSAVLLLRQPAVLEPAWLAAQAAAGAWPSGAQLQPLSLEALFLELAQPQGDGDAR